MPTSLCFGHTARSSDTRPCSTRGQPFTQGHKNDHLLSSFYSASFASSHASFRLWSLTLTAATAYKDITNCKTVANSLRSAESDPANLLVDSIEFLKKKQFTSLMWPPASSRNVNNQIDDAWHVLLKSLQGRYWPWVFIVWLGLWKTTKQQYWHMLSSVVTAAFRTYDTHSSSIR